MLSDGSLNLMLGKIHFWFCEGLHFRRMWWPVIKDWVTEKSFSPLKTWLWRRAEFETCYAEAVGSNLSLCGKVHSCSGTGQPSELGLNPSWSWISFFFSFSILKNCQKYSKQRSLLPWLLVQEGNKRRPWSCHLPGLTLQIKESLYPSFNETGFAANATLSDLDEPTSTLTSSSDDSDPTRLALSILPIRELAIQPEVTVVNNFSLQYTWIMSIHLFPSQSRP